MMGENVKRHDINRRESYNCSNYILVAYSLNVSEARGVKLNVFIKDDPSTMIAEASDLVYAVAIFASRIEAS